MQSEDVLSAVHGLHASLDVAQVTLALAEYCARLLPVRAVAVLRWHPEQHRFTLGACQPSPPGEPLRGIVEQWVGAPTVGEVRPWAALDEAGLVMALPLQKTHLLGAVVLEAGDASLWDEATRGLAQILVLHGAQALHNALAFARTDATLQQRVIELSTIQVVSRQIAAAFDLERIAGDVLAAAISATGAASGRCALVTDTGGLTLAAYFDRFDSPAPPTALCVPNLELTHRSVMARALVTREPLVIDDVARLAVWPDDLPLETRAALVMPLLREDRAIGVLCLEATEPQAFDSRDAHLVLTLAEHAAIAIENARLYQQVRAGRDQLQAILDSTHEALLLFDRQGRLQRFNAVAETMLGFSLAPYLHQGPAWWVRDLGPERLPQLIGLNLREFRAYVRAIQAQPTALQRRQFVQRVKDTLRYVEETASPVLDPQGQFAGWLVVWRDSTEKHQLEQLRLDLSEMIVHDLRNPLTAISSSLMMLRDLITEGETRPELLLEVVEIAQNSVNYMSNLVQSILDVSRLEHNLSVLECESVALADCVDYALKSVYSQAFTANVTLTAQLPPDLPPVWIDADMIQRVLINLLDNAVRHTPRHGQVCLSARAEPDDQAMLVCVDDSGPGIPPEVRTRIFDKFVQLERRALRGHKGTGLGLTFCKLAVEAHGGRIWVEDSPYGGASFRFTLPLAPSFPPPVA